MAVDPFFEYQFRIILIGDSTVGKSSLLRYFVDGKFEDICDPTVGVDFFARVVELNDGVKIKLQLWDTAGQERFRSITKSYYRNSVGAILVYDISRKRTFDSLPDWLTETKRYIEPEHSAYMLIGHKCDKEVERQVTTREGQMFASYHGIPFFETSAKTGQNIEHAFREVAQQVYDLILAGKIIMEDGWEGVKPGYRRPAEQIQLQEYSERAVCCL